jgi:hypothetical protein
MPDKVNVTTILIALSFLVRSLALLPRNGEQQGEDGAKPNNGEIYLVSLNIDHWNSSLHKIQTTILYVGSILTVV